MIRCLLGGRSSSENCSPRMATRDYLLPGYKYPFSSRWRAAMKKDACLLALEAHDFSRVNYVKGSVRQGVVAI